MGSAARWQGAEIDRVFTPAAWYPLCTFHR